MDEKELSVYEQEFINVLNEIRELFLAKNRGYNGENNPLLNFMLGGRLLYNNDGYIGCFEALKAYMAKHVSNIYTHTIKAPNIEESCKDIATYMIIATVMKRMDTLAERAEEPTEVIPEVLQEEEKTSQEPTGPSVAPEDIHAD